MSTYYKYSDNLPYEKVGENEPICIAEEVPFEIPDSWEWVRLSSIASVQGGKRIPAGRKLSIENTGHIYIRVSDMKNSTVLEDSLMYVPNDIYPSISKYIINKEDVYITVAGTIGSVGKIPKELDGANLTENADKIVFKNINQDWLIIYLSSNFVQNQIAEATTKVGQPKLAIKRIEKLLIALPNLAEQKRIVEKIEQLLPYIEKYDKVEQKNTQLDLSFPDLLKKSILQEAIQGKLVPQDPNDEPASELIKRIRAEKEQLIKEGKIKKDKHESYIFRRDNSHYEKLNGEERCIDEELPFEIPKSWEWVRLGNIGEWGSGSTPSRTNADYYGGNIPWLKTGDLNDSYITFIPECITKKALEETSVRLNLTGSVLIAMYGATIGKLGILTFPATTNQACCACLPIKIYNKFLFYYLMAMKTFFIKQGEGGAQPNISKEKIVETLFPVPPLSEQQRIVEKIEKLLPYIESLKI